MAKKITILQVLVSSPNDVADEREAVAEAVQELNLTWRKTTTIQLNLLRWETDSRPSLGADAQAVLNEQLGDDYDIFVGIMAARFGTPTGRAESGTEEEFDRAQARFEKKRDVSVMFYFKDSPPASLSEIDPKQLERVQTFRRKVEKLGLVRIFKTRDEFARLIRMHLSQEAQAWLSSREPHPTHAKLGEEIAAPITEIEMTGTDVTEEGYLDLIERGEEAFQNVVQIIEHIGAATREVAEKTEQRRAEIDDINARAAATKTAPDLKAIKRATNHIASALEEFVTRLDAEIPLYAAGFKRAFDPFVEAIGMPDIKRATVEELDTAIKATKGMIENQGQAIDSYHQLRDVLLATPRLTTALNRARRRAVDSMNRLIEEFEKSLRLASEFYEFLRNSAAK